MDVRKANVLLCSVVAALLMTGCGEMPDLTQEETDLISEYAVGVLVKQGTPHGSRLVDIPEEEPEEEALETEEENIIEEEPETEGSAEVVDVSQDEEETQTMVSSVEEYYGIPNIMISYTGCEVVDSYPPMEEGEDFFFFLGASSPETQLLVLKFNAQNVSGEDQLMDMLGYGASFRVSVNGEADKGALATSLPNDMQTYDGVVPANSAVEMVSIVEVPQGTNPGSIDFILRGNGEDGTLRLQ